MELEAQKRDFEEFKMLLQKLIKDSDYGLPGQFYRSYSYTAQANKGDLDPEKDFQIINSKWRHITLNKFIKLYNFSIFKKSFLFLCNQLLLSHQTIFFHLFSS